MKTQIESYQYKDLNHLSNWVKILTCCYIASLLANIVQNFLLLQLLNRLFAAFQAQDYGNIQAIQHNIDGIFSTQNITRIFFIVLFICSTIAVSIWIYRANANALALGLGIKKTPGWAIGSFFIPLADMFAPYQAMKKMACNSLNAVQKTLPALLLPFWWGTWLLYRIIGGISAKMQLDAEQILKQTNPDDLQSILSSLQLLMNIQQTGWIADASGIICALLLLNLVPRVTQAQTQIAQTIIKTPVQADQT